MKKRGRPRKLKPLPEFLQGGIPEYIKKLGEEMVCIKLGKVRGWKAPLDYRYSGLDETMMNLLNPPPELALKEFHADTIRTAINKATTKSSANDVRSAESLQKRTELYKKYTECFNKHGTHSAVAECIKRRMDHAGEKCSIATLRKDVAKIRQEKKLARLDLTKKY